LHRTGEKSGYRRFFTELRGKRAENEHIEHFISNRAVPCWIRGGLRCLKLGIPLGLNASSSTTLLLLNTRLVTSVPKGEAFKDSAKK